MTITLNEIPLNWKKPGVFTEIRPRYGNMGLAEFPARSIIVAPKLATGAALAETLYPITRKDEGIAYCGLGSAGAEMVDIHWRNNDTTETFIIGIADDAEGINATGTFTVVGAPTYGGPLPIYIEDVRISIATTAGQTVAAIATALAAAINARTELPVTAAAALGVVTVTARHKGEIGNGYSLGVARRQGDMLPAGTTVTVVAMSGGANNPDIDDVLDAIGNEWFTDLVLPFDDATTLGKVAAWAAARFEAMAKLDVEVYVGHRGNYAALVAKGAITNSPFIAAIGAYGSPSAPHKWAAMLGAIGAFHLTNDPSRQLRSLVGKGIEAPRAFDCFEETEQNLLLGKGISTFNRLRDGSVTLDRVVTTYKVSNLNVPDLAWMDIMVPKTTSRIRYDWGAYALLNWPRHKLAKDNTIAADHADAVSTPNRVKGAWAARSVLYERRGWIQDSARTSDLSTFEINDSDKNTLNSVKVINIIGNQMVLAGALEFEA